MSVHVFLPCRKGSERVPKKNIIPFAGKPFGLVSIKLEQLLSCAEIDEVVLSTNDEDILNYADSLSSTKLTIHHRCDELSLSSTSTDELVAHALSLIPDGDILWTHVTSPFVNSEIYTQIIRQYRSALATGFDSLMTTSKIHGFLWNEHGPINYDRKLEKWPRTQTIPAIHEINSAVFLASAEIYRQMNDRIGEKPLLYPLDKITSQDIDWQEDFILAEMMVQAGLVQI